MNAEGYSYYRSGTVGSVWRKKEDSRHDPLNHKLNVFFSGSVIISDSNAELKIRGFYYEKFRHNVTF
jgi:hypothetical protein